MKKFGWAVMMLAVTTAFGQRVENTSSYRNIGAEHYVRVNYENDFFALSDEYYTQGVNIEFVAPAMAKFPLAKLLYQNKHLPTRTGIAIEHQGFTPSNILTGDVLERDRPYSSSLMLKTFSMISNPHTNHRLATQFSLGVIGPWAMGKEIQIALHERINPDKVPKGWKNQVHNDIILNYQVEYEHGLWVKRNFIVTAKGGARAGTYNTRLSSSFTMMGGYFDNPFQFANSQNKKFQVYFFAEPQLNLVVFDATLQGGVFNDRSPYTLDRNEISRFVFQQNAGLVIKIKSLVLEYSQALITREFKAGTAHSWGSVRAAWSF
ncbi:MAG TPA: lipid A deacylase LpxR family protein [Cyclobacteriaceae bacterium]|nr:lipid A deacylase LpxR family protein [Cyclobacteriaceae bacterium]HMV09577.1 lipid A deacylase LpxR family protein [Cyclobacteriaceae bacterium]HMV90481.1 lipid A deacylase LpxR family protein [Cyclobacteriaceae bacterium]HMX01960.1 lipid A deacylase LpxR family protein [Cyclobacteriaceae bacterium]HMX51939.1 lipid A deacylase LpxR family protein [Cyclobacteriaceae bacterium]